MLAIKKDGMCLPSAACFARVFSARFPARAKESKNAVSFGFFRLAASASLTMISTPSFRY